MRGGEQTPPPPPPWSTTDVVSYLLQYNLLTVPCLHLYKEYTRAWQCSTSGCFSFKHSFGVFFSWKIKTVSQRLVKSDHINNTSPRSIHRHFLKFHITKDKQLIKSLGGIMICTEFQLRIGKLMEIIYFSFSITALFLIDVCAEAMVIMVR